MSERGNYISDTLDILDLLEANLRFSMKESAKLRQAIKDLWRLYLITARKQLPDWVIDLDDMTELENYNISQILKALESQQP